MGLPCILITEGSDGKIAKTIASNVRGADVRILQMDAMQSTTLAMAQAGTTYLSVMEENLAVLKEALQ